MNLFTVAANNAISLEKRFEDLKSSLSVVETDCLSRFADRVVQHGRISINMRQSVLVSFLMLGKHQNIYEWAASRAGFSSKSDEELIREKLNGYYERRVTFDRHFDLGERFRYGALNIGGVGATNYGEFCAVLTDHVFSSRDDVAYLSADSLETYMLPGPTVDEAAIQRDAAPHTHRHYLAALKHNKETSRKTEDRWPSLLCSSTDYVEAIFVNEVIPPNLEAVRISKSDYKRLYDYAFDESRKKLEEDERWLAETFVMILRYLKEHKIPLQEV